MARSTRTVTPAAKPRPPARTGPTSTRPPAKKVAAAQVVAPAVKTMRGAAKSGKSVPAPARKVAAVAAAPKALLAPKPSKEELKAHVEKLERSVVTLRAKSRDMTRAAKVANGRIAELEAEVTQLEEVVAQAKAAAKPTKQPTKRPKAPRAAKTSREPAIEVSVAIDSAAPPDVAAEDPQPLDEKAETASTAMGESLPVHR